jgi:hypothetical protein
MLTTIGRLPAAVAVSLGGVDQGGGIYDVSLAVGAMVRALGGVESSIPADARYTEDGAGAAVDVRYQEDGVTIRETEV